MDLALTEVLKRLRQWGKKDTLIQALMFTHSQELKVKVSGRIRTEGEAFTLTYDTGDLSVELTEDMRFKYGDVLLETRAPSWRCILHEARD